MSNLSLQLMSGVDVPIPELQLVAHVPRIKEIAMMGETNFFTAIQYLCIDKEQLMQDKIPLYNFTNFQVLMKVLEQLQDKSVKQNIITLLNLMFPDYRVVITPRSIILTKEEPIMIDENNFDSFQKIIGEILCAHNLFAGKNVIYNPKGKKAKEIAQKIMRGRKKVAELKAGEAGESVLSRYISVLTIGVSSLDIEKCNNYTLYQLFDLMERYTAYIEWDVDLRVRLTGTTPDKEVKNWMGDLHSSN